MSVGPLKPETTHPRSSRRDVIPAAFCLFRKVTGWSSRNRLAFPWPVSKRFTFPGKQEGGQRQQVGEAAVRHRCHLRGAAGMPSPGAPRARRLGQAGGPRARGAGEEKRRVSPRAATSEHQENTKSLLHEFL